MKIYTLTFTDYVHNVTMLIGNFSSYDNAWSALLDDKNENMKGIGMLGSEIDSNPELGLGSYSFFPRDVNNADAYYSYNVNVYYSYNVNVTELDEVLDANHQVEL